MFSGYDPSYNPENLEKAKQKAEQGELSPEQAATANKWSEAMKDVGETSAEEAPEATIEAAAEGGGDEAEPTIAETEPQLMQQLAENMDADGLPTDDELTALEDTQAEATTEEAAPAGKTSKKTHMPKEGKPMNGTPLRDKMDPDKDLANMAIMTPAGEMLAKSVEIAVDAAEEGIPELIEKVADKIPNGEDEGSEGKSGEPAEETSTEEAPAEEAPAEEAPSAIQHFSAEQKEPSGFNPLPPEEQRDQKSVAEEAHAKSYSDPGEADAFNARDDNNLVAQAVSNELADGGVNLNGVGSNLKGDGVDIGNEVSQLDADIATDLSAAGATGDIDSFGKDSTTANNLAVEAGAVALASKEAAGKAMAEAKSGGDSAMEKIEEANRRAEQAQELADASEEVSSAIGVNNTSEMLGNARKMAEDAKEMATSAEAVAAEKAAEDKANDDANKKDAKDVFSADDYPEMNDIGDGEVGAITG